LLVWFFDFEEIAYRRQDEVTIINIAIKKKYLKI
jgi:hypothetical protein